MSKPAVYFDTNVLIEFGRTLENPLLERLQVLVHADIVKIVATDVGILELINKFSDDQFNLVRETFRHHVREAIKTYAQVEMPEISREDLRGKVTLHFENTINNFYKKLNAEILSIDTVIPSKILHAYAKRTGIFSKDAKKDQFPDAFAYECIKNKLGNYQKIYIVSSDVDFERLSKDDSDIEVVKDISELFRALGLSTESADVDAFIAKNSDLLAEMFSAELNDWGLESLDVEDASIEGITVHHFEVLELTSFGVAGEGKEILATGEVRLDFSAEYHHPNWDEAMWDSENKVLIPFENVSDEAEGLQTSPHFILKIGTDDKGLPSEILEVRFTGDSFMYVQLYPVDPWEYV